MLNLKTMKPVICIFLLFLLGLPSKIYANFYQENRNGKTFILQVDPGTGIETVFNQDKQIIFIAAGAKRIAVLPTAGWGDYVTNQDPYGAPLPTSQSAGDVNGILNLRFSSAGGGITYSIYRGASILLTSITDTSTFAEPAQYDLAVSQFMGNNKDKLRVFLFISSFYNASVIYRFEFTNNVITRTSYKYLSPPLPGAPGPGPLNWTDIEEIGNMATAQSINVNAKSDTDDLLVYHPSRQYSLQHVWNASNNGGYWGINYLMNNNVVYKANATNLLTNDINFMSPIFNVAQSLGNAYVDSISYFRSYYNVGVTFVQLNVNTNSSLANCYEDIRDPGGPVVQIRDGSPTGSVLETIGVNPNPTIVSHNASLLYNLSCQNALSGSELIVYEPIYKLNQGAISAGEFTDTNRNNVPDFRDNDGLGYWGYRNNYLIDRPNGSVIDNDYELDFVIAHRFSLSGKTANNEFTYREYAIERDGSASPAALIPGEVVHVRVGNIWHRDPDVYGEYGQFGWDGNPGSALFLWVGNGGDPYNTQNAAVVRNSGKILGAEVKNTSYATADHFGVVGNDEWAAGQGDVYLLARKFGSYISPRIVASNNPYTPPVSGYGRWWKFQYDRQTYYGLSRTYWIASSPNTSWLNNNFFIGNSIYSQMVYNVNCGCRGQRYGNFILESAVSSPINDFSIVNIGAPPFVTGVIAPTISANQGAPVIQPNTPVLFTGSYQDPVRLVATSTVMYRYVILDDTFNDVNPASDSSLVIDSGLISTINWSYIFKDTDLRGRSIATFSVYLGIQYEYQDYESMPYPAYSWWQVPLKQTFAWSNSNNGAYYDGLLHGRYGAPLRITVGSIQNLTPQHPLVVTNVQARTETTSFVSGVTSVPQNQRVKLLAKGKMMLLSEIPEPLDVKYVGMGGILPHSDNTRVWMDNPGGVQRDAARANTVLTSSDFAKDLQYIRYEWYIKAGILDSSNNRDRLYTYTFPNDINSHLLYEGALPTMEGYQAIASGTFDGAGLTNSNLFEPGLSIVRITPAPVATDTNHRIFDFEIETPWVSGFPTPLDAGLGDDRDKYEIRIAFKYPVGAWNRVTVKNYDTNIITDSYSSSKTEDQIERSLSLWGTQTQCHILVTDTEGPVVSLFATPQYAPSGDLFPTGNINLQIVDNNPNDYQKRGRTYPGLYWIYSIGDDSKLNITSNSPANDALSFDFSDRNTNSAFAITPTSANVKTTPTLPTNVAPYWAYLSNPVYLSGWQQTIASFPGPCSTIFSIPSGMFIPAQSLYAPVFNPHSYAMRFYLYDSGPSFSGGVPVVSIVDGSNNPFSGGQAEDSTFVQDNDPPNLRVILQDQTNLDVMFEVKGGLKDEPVGSRYVFINNLKNNQALYEANVSTPTPQLPVASITEVYDLNTLQTGTPSGYSVTQAFPVGTIPLKVQADTRFKATATAYDSTGLLPLDVSLRIEDPNIGVSGNNSIETVFRRGLVGNQYTLICSTTDGAGHQVILNIPLIIESSGNITIRTIEESFKRIK